MLPSAGLRSPARDAGRGRGVAHGRGAYKCAAERSKRTHERSTTSSTFSVPPRAPACPTLAVTPDHTHVNVRCGGLYHMIDVGMSSAYYGSLAAWRCEPRADLGAGWASVRALYPPDVLRSTPAGALLQTVYVPPSADGSSSDGSSSPAAADAARVDPASTLRAWQPAIGPRTGVRSTTSAANLAVECARGGGCDGLSIEGDVGESKRRRGDGATFVRRVAHERWRADDGGQVPLAAVHQSLAVEPPRAEARGLPNLVEARDRMLPTPRAHEESLVAAGGGAACAAVALLVLLAFGVACAPCSRGRGVGKGRHAKAAGGLLEDPHTV